MFRYSLFFTLSLFNSILFAQILPPFLQDGWSKILEPRKKSEEIQKQINYESEAIVQVLPNRGNKICGQLSYVRQTQFFDIKVDDNQSVRVLLHPVVLNKNFDIYVLIDQITSNYGCAYLSKFAYRMPNGINIWKGTIFSGYPAVDIGLIALKRGWGFYIPDADQANNQAQTYEKAQAHARKWRIGVYSEMTEIPSWVYEFHKQ